MYIKFRLYIIDREEPKTYLVTYIIVKLAIIRSFVANLSSVTLNSLENNKTAHSRQTSSLHCQHTKCRCIYKSMRSLQRSDIIESSHSESYTGISRTLERVAAARHYGYATLMSRGGRRRGRGARSHGAATAGARVTGPAGRPPATDPLSA